MNVSALTRQARVEHVRRGHRGRSREGNSVGRPKAVNARTTLYAINGAARREINRRVGRADRRRRRNDVNGERSRSVNGGRERDSERRLPGSAANDNVTRDVDGFFLWADRFCFRL